MTKQTGNDHFIESIMSAIKESILDKKETKKDSAIKSTYLRLTKENMNKKDIIEKIASVILAEMYYALEHKEYKLFSERFHENLENLPKTPCLNN